jgi:hypothetical protein
MNAELRIWTLALLAMVVLVLAVSAGCIGHEYVVNRDIVVLKLSPDGSLEWTKVVDNGFDDMAEDLVELPGGGYALAGSIADGRRAWPRPVLIQLSPDGAVASQRFVTDGFGVARAVALADDGGTAVLTGNGTVVRFTPDGQVLWTRLTGIPEAQALVRTADGGFLAGGQSEELPVNDTGGPGIIVQLPVTATETGAESSVHPRTVEPVASRTTLPLPRPGGMRLPKAMVVRLAPDGAIAWEGLYDNGGLEGVQSCAEGPDRAGFLVAGYGYNSSGSVGSNPLLALRLGPDGAPSSVTQVDSTWDSIWTRADVAGYRVLYRNTSLTESGFDSGSVIDAILDRDGRVLERRFIDASIVVTWTANGGYFSVGVPAGGNGLYDDAPVCSEGGCIYHARTFDSQGALVADRALLVPQFDQAQKVVQTADGGFAVLAYKNNR